MEGDWLPGVPLGCRFAGTGGRRATACLDTWKLKRYNMREFRFWPEMALRH